MEEANRDSPSARGSDKDDERDKEPVDERAVRDESDADGVTAGATSDDCERSLDFLFAERIGSVKLVLSLLNAVEAAASPEGIDAFSVAFAFGVAFGVALGAAFGFGIDLALEAAFGSAGLRPVRLS